MQMLLLLFKYGGCLDLKAPLMVGNPPESRLLLLRLSFWDSLCLFSPLCARPRTHSLINYMSV